MDRGLIMVLHAAIVAVALYAIMLVVLKQDKHVAEDRSILIGAVVLAYMVLFGHGWPKRVNPNVW